MQTYFLRNGGIDFTLNFVQLLHQSLGFFRVIYTLPQTYHFAPQKEGLFPQKEGLNSSNSSDSGAMSVSFREGFLFITIK